MNASPAAGDGLVVGFVGLGTMGKPMAANLVRSGADVVVFDLDGSPVNELAALGARSAESLRDLALQCDIIEVAVWDSAGVEAVLIGDGSNESIIESARPGTIIAIHSTVSLETCRKVDAKARERGIRVIDAAMSGGAGLAAEGRLAIMAGGEREAFDACKPILDVLGDSVFHVGPLGAGMAAKLCNNLMVLVNLEAVAQALAIAEAAGIGNDDMIELASAGTADSWALRYGYTLQRKAKASAAYENQVRMQVKDLELAVQLATDLGLAGEQDVASFFLDRARRHPTS